MSLYCDVLQIYGFNVLIFFEYQLIWSFSTVLLVYTVAKQQWVKRRGDAANVDSNDGLTEMLGMTAPLRWGGRLLLYLG